MKLDSEQRFRPRHRSRLSTWQVAAIIILAVIIAVGASFLLQKKPPQNQPDLRRGLVQELPAPISDTGVDNMPAQELPAPRGDAAPETPESGVKSGSQAREIIRSVREEGGQDMDSVATQAERFVVEGKLTDAHLLLFFAAKQGHALSSRLLGGMYDPIHHSDKTSIMEGADAAQAYKWYKQAADGGDQAAVVRLDVLKLWVERAASEGDQAAKHLLLEWK